MKLTASQTAIVEFMTLDLPVGDREEGRGQVMSVPAVAGSGKSLTIIELARRCPSKRLLFLSQSRNVVDRARGTLPSNVTIRTVYEIAARHVRLTHREKMQDARPQSRLDVNAIRKVFPSATRQEITLAIKILDRFFASSGTFPEPKHIPWKQEAEGDNPRKGIHPALSLARDIWFSQSSRDTKALPLTFDALIKLWTLSTPETVQIGDNSRSVTIKPIGEHDIVVLEEAQESTEALINFIARQTNEILMLGDPFQALRPGSPAIQNLRHPLHQRSETVFMGESWRFGPCVAGVLNALTNKAGSSRQNRIIGKGDSRIYSASQQWHWLRTGHHYTCIANKSSTLFQVALDAMRQGKSLAWVDGAMSYPLVLLRDLALLAAPHDPLLHTEGPVQIQTPHLKNYRNLHEARSHFEQTSDSLGLDLCLFVELNSDKKLHAAATHWIREDHQRQEALLRGETPERDITLCSITRCKGHEFPRVAIADDLLDPEILADWNTPSASRRAINRLYTAISRTQFEVSLPDALLDHLKHHSWPVATSQEDNTFEATDFESGRHPYFGVHRHFLLEMSPKVRDKRRRILPEKTTRLVTVSGQESIREKVMDEAHVLAEKDPAILRDELFGRRRRKKP